VESGKSIREIPVQEIAAARQERLSGQTRRGRNGVAGDQAFLQVIDPSELSDSGFPDIPDGWSWVPCGDLCQPERALTYGVIKLGPEVEDGVPTLRSSDVRWLLIEEGHIKRISPRIAAEFSRTFLQGGEVLITVRGTLGGVAVSPTHMKGFNVSREVAVVPVEPTLEPWFIAFSVAADWSQNWLSGVTRGVAYTGVNIEDLKRLPLPVPPLSEQREIVRRVEALFALAEGIEAHVRAATVRAERLPQSILARAFRGELVPTEADLASKEGRDYEPASVLLERIQETRKQHKPAKRGRGGKNMAKRSTVEGTAS
jgi:type I restriction enzyme S subunit